MRLADFILQHQDAILAEWDLFAGSNEPAASSMDSKALRNHAAQMLQAFALDLATAQTPQQARDKSQARGPLASENSAASIHGEARLLSGFTIDQLLAEYRALRASVLHLWTEGKPSVLITDLDDMTRFNEAVDQAVAESVARYSRMINHSQHLFLAILGHDLRNPLNTTVVASQVLMRVQGMDPAHAEVAAKIHRSGLRMSKLVDDLIDYTRSHLGSSLPMAMTTTDMAEVANAAADELRLVRPDRTIDVIVEGSASGSWDEGRIAQVLSNLLGNAMQHSASTSPITVRVSGHQQDVRVSVHNFGEPIDPAAMGMIFDPLVRVASTSQRGGERNLGIGLYIARAIVEAHGGHITATSDQQGTTFAFTLPARQSPDPVLQAV
jgi:signal transduction histidine kinase